MVQSINPFDTLKTKVQPVSPIVQQTTVVTNAAAGSTTTTTVIQTVVGDSAAGTY